jgi:uncharacterized membrane protein
LKARPATRRRSDDAVFPRQISACVGAIVILGTGTGIAFFMLMAHRSRDAAFIARTAETVVIADMLFTLTAVLLQPVSGGVLMWLSSTAWSERWLLTSLGLYAVAGLFWVPVIFMQIEMRDLARKAAEHNQSCRRATTHFSTAGFYWDSRFWLCHGYSLVDDRQTALGSMNADIRKILVLGASGLIGRFVTDDLRARGFPWWASPANCPPRRRAARSISNCLSCRWKRRRWRGCCAITASMSWSIASACCRTARQRHAVVHCDFVARLLQAIRDSDARSGWCISRFPARPRPTAPPSAPPSARPSG